MWSELHVNAWITSSGSAKAVNAKQLKDYDLKNNKRKQWQLVSILINLKYLVYGAHYQYLLALVLKTQPLEIT